MRSILYAAPVLLIASGVRAQFSAPQPIEETEYAYMGLAVIADLNGDGANDVVAGGQGDMDGLGCFINDGTGGFSAVQWIDTTSFVDYRIGVVAGDVDGDGDNDLIAYEDYTRAFYYENLGPAQFAPPQEIISSIGDTRRENLVDIDGDGDLDLALIDYWNDAVNWYENLGGGAFGPAEIISSALTGVSDMQWTDVDGDSDTDLITVRYQGETAWFANDGTGTFGAMQPIADMGTNVYDLNTADLDGDGDEDLLSGSSFDNVATWYTNNGAGVFSGPQLIANSENWALNNVADMDGDGDLDVIPCSGQTPFWCENNGSGSFIAQHPVSLAYIGESRAVDMDADGDPDIATVYGSVSWQANDGLGNMGHRQMICTTVPNISEVRLVDLDGDSDLDVAANRDASGGMVVFYRNDGTGAFSVQQVAVDTLYSVAGLEFADLDGDLDQDMVVQGYFVLGCYMNNGTGTFTPGDQLNVASQGVYGVELSDFDADGDIDVVSVDYYDDVLELWRNDGSGGFAPAETVAAVLIPRGVQSGDIDGDGDADLLSYTGDTDGLSWYQNDGTASFTEVPIGTLDEQVDADDIQVADFNGDGTMDLVYGGYETVVVHWNTGGGVFQNPVELFPVIDYSPTAEAADVDMDGDVDLLIGTSDVEQFSWRANDGSGVFGPDQMLFPALGGVPASSPVGDIDGDGHVDIVLGHGNGGETYGIHWFESFVSSQYHIQGTAFHDADEDAIQDPGEGGLPFLLATATPIASMPLTDPNGDFDISADEGTYDVQVLAPALWGLTTSPASYQVTVDDITPISTGNVFGYAPVVDTTILVLGISASAGPCFGQGVQFLSVTNLGTTQPSGSICYTLSPAFTFTSSTPAPTSITGNVYCWDYDSLFYYSQQLITINVSNPDTSWMGDPFTCILTVIEEDEGGSPLHTFSDTLTNEVACAYDPNDKQVTPAGYGEAGAVDIATEFLDYRIRFQNTGNAPATDVVLHDQLSTHLDWTSLQVIGYSHPVTSVVIEEDGELIVSFLNIQLPDSSESFEGSQGFFSFRLRPVAGLAHGTVIENTAAIHFDLNPAVVTNTTTTTLVDCSLWSVADITVSGFSTLMAPAGDAYQWFLDAVAIAGATSQSLVITEDGDYTVQVTSEYGCTSTSDAYAATDVGIDEENGSVVAIIPNPFSERTEVIFREPLTAQHTIQLLDVNGRTVRELNANGSRSLIVQRDELASGLYTLRIASPDRAATTVHLVVGP